MSNRLHRYLLIASLALSGCATSPKAPPQSIRPSLDQYLSNDCQLIGEPPQSNDFDALLGWVQSDILPKYADCAIRHRKTVDAWPTTNTPTPQP